MTMTAREAFLKCAEAADSRFAGMAQQMQDAGRILADTYRAFADTLTEGPQTERDAAKGIKELDLDGLELTPGTTLIGKAMKHDGEWRCLANWHGSMVVVALNITPADSDRAKDAAPSRHKTVT
jgi:hypothetical protein